MPAPEIDLGVRAMVAAIIHDTFCPDATEPEPMFLSYSARAGDSILAYLSEQGLLVKPVGPQPQIFPLPVELRIAEIEADAGPLSEPEKQLIRACYGSAIPLPPIEDDQLAQELGIVPKKERTGE